MESPMSRSLKALVILHNSLKTEPCPAPGVKGSSLPSCSLILLLCLTCWQGVSFFPLKIVSWTVTNWQKIKTPSWPWKWNIRKGISSALEVLSSHTTSLLGWQLVPGICWLASNWRGINFVQVNDGWEVMYAIDSRRKSYLRKKRRKQPLGKTNCLFNQTTESRLTIQIAIYSKKTNKRKKNPKTK